MTRVYVTPIATAVLPDGWDWRATADPEVFELLRDRQPVGQVWLRAGVEHTAAFMAAICAGLNRQEESC